MDQNGISNKCSLYNKYIIILNKKYIKAMLNNNMTISTLKQ